MDQNLHRKFPLRNSTKRFTLFIPVPKLAVTVEGYGQHHNTKEDQYKPRVIISTDISPLDAIPGGDCHGPESVSKWREDWMLPE